MMGQAAVVPSLNHGHLGLIPSGRAWEEIDLRMMSKPDPLKAASTRT